MLTTLFGKSIWILRQNLPDKLMSPGCAARIAVHTLYQIKQLHEVGYILRDLKIGLLHFTMKSCGIHMCILDILLEINQ